MLVFFGIVLVSCYLLLQKTELAPDPGLPRRVEPIVEELEEFDTLSSSESPIDVLAPRAPAIHGRVVDAKREPLAGIEVVCGSDVSQTDADGRFGFSASVRPGPLTVALRRDGAEIVRWSDVVVGDISDGSWSSTDIPRPESLRWSVTLFEAEGSKSLLGLSSVLVEEWGRSGVVHVHGTGGLPEGAEIHAAVYFLND